MKKKIALCIIIISALIGVLINVFLYKANTEIKEIELSQYTTKKQLVKEVEIKSDNFHLEISGYIEEEVFINRVKILLILKSQDNKYYSIPTEFIEVSSEEEVENLIRDKVGFYTKINITRQLEKGDYDLFLLDESDNLNNIVYLEHLYIGGESE